MKEVGLDYAPTVSRDDDGIHAGKLNKPDAEDPDIVNHLNWYMSTGFTRRYPGETKVRPPRDFKNSAPAGDGDDFDN
jgi:hypothetical protein